MDRAYWRKLSEYIEENTILTCPFCNEGHLILNNTGVKFDEISDDLINAENKEFEFNCYSQNCTKITKAVGKLFKSKITSIGSCNIEYKLRFVPNSFSPPLIIIHTNPNFPIHLTESLNLSFNFFFNDKEKCLENLNEIINEISPVLNSHQTTVELDDNIIESILRKYEIIESF